MPEPMTEKEAVVAIAKVLAAWWHDPVEPFNNEREAYGLVRRVTRDLLGNKEDNYDRAVLETECTVELYEHFKINGGASA